MPTTVTEEKDDLEMFKCLVLEGLAACSQEVITLPLVFVPAWCLCLQQYTRGSGGGRVGGGKSHCLESKS